MPSIFKAKNSLYPSSKIIISIYSIIDYVRLSVRHIDKKKIPSIVQVTAIHNSLLLPIVARRKRKTKGTERECNKLNARVRELPIPL